MITDINSIIRILSQTSNTNKTEFIEQEGESAAASSSAGASAGSSQPSTPSSYPQVSKWESGIKRGKTYGGPGYKWESGRTMGKTYGGPGYKWTTGMVRGPGNKAKEG